MAKRNPNVHRLRLWTGPIGVKEIATSARRAGYHVTEGTEHIYVESEGSDRAAAHHNFLVDLKKSAGTDYGLRVRNAKKKASKKKPAKRAKVAKKRANKKPAKRKKSSRRAWPPADGVWRKGDGGCFLGKAKRPCDDDYYRATKKRGKKKISRATFASTMDAHFSMPSRAKSLATIKKMKGVKQVGRVRTSVWNQKFWGD